MSSGILNREWAVLPPGNKREATPDEATARTILPFERKSERIAFQTIPVPPCPDRKKKPGFLLKTDYNFINVVEVAKRSARSYDCSSWMSLLNLF